MTDSVRSAPDSFTRQEKARYEKESLISARLKNERDRRDQAAREVYSERVYLLAINWIVIVLTILCVDGCVQMNSYFEVSDNVMITLIGATTATVLGLFAFVMKYLFHRDVGGKTKR